MPRRKPAYRRVTPLASRRETQRRAAARDPRPGHRRRRPRAGGLRVRRQHAASRRSARSTPASRRSTRREADLAKVTGPGIDLVTDDPDQALQLLTHAHEQLAIAAGGQGQPDGHRAARWPRPSPASTGCTGSSRSRARSLFAFKPAEGATRDRPVGAWSAAPTACRTSSTGRRSRSAAINLKTQRATLVVTNGTKNKAAPSPNPRYLAVGGQDLLILDAKNVLWRWRPADDAGKGTLTRVTPRGRRLARRRRHRASTRSCGPGRAACTTCTSSTRPSSRSAPTRRRPTAAASRPSRARGWRPRATSRAMTSTYVDGDIFVADGGAMLRFVGGKAEGWEAKDPEDDAAPAGADVLARGRPGRRGARARSTASTRPNARIIALDKVGRLVPRAVPAGRRPEGLGRPARDVRHRREPRTSRRRSSGCPRHASTRPSSSRSRTWPRRRAQRPSANPSVDRPDQGDPETHQEALTGAPVIPLRDANPTRRTPLVTLSLIIACFVAFAWELGLLASGGEAALEAFITELGRRPGRPDRGLGARRLRCRTRPRRW